MSVRPGQYVRDHYGVPAFIGRPVIYTYDNEMPRLGKITGFDGQYLIVKFDDDQGRHGPSERMHPTWEIRYPLDHDGLPLEASDD